MADHPITLGAVNVEASDPHALAGFWAALLGATVRPAGPTAFLDPSGPAGFGMFFQPLDADRAGHQVTHLDLTVPWGTREQVAARAVELGAAYEWEVTTESEHVRWTTLTDPEGNYLCIAEHPPLD